MVSNYSMTKPHIDVAVIGSSAWLGHRHHSATAQPRGAQYFPADTLTTASERFSGGTKLEDTRVGIDGISTVCPDVAAGEGDVHGCRSNSAGAFSYQ